MRINAADAQILGQWIGVAVQNLELMVAWIVAWPLFHLGMIVVGRLVLGPDRGMPTSILIPVEVIPGFLFGLSTLRVTTSFQRLYRIIKAVGDARSASRPTPPWTQHRGLRLELMTPSDWDFLAALALVATIELLTR